jgi:PTH1 family peptidyl-tRNA hydrolase
MPFSPESPLLLVGLGNPGSKYSNTPHNIGFEVIDKLKSRWGAPDFQQKFHSEWSQYAHVRSGRKVFLLKPQTYMNRSGLAVAEASGFFKIPVENVLVLSDDLDLPVGTLRLRPSGGAGGHNGLKSIIECVGGQAFPRLRIGVGRSDKLPPDVHLLSRIGKAEAVILAEAVETAAQAVEACLDDGFEKAMNVFNLKRRSDES